MTIRASASAALIACLAAAPLCLGQDGVSWVPSGNNLTFTAGNVCIGTTNPAYRLYVVSQTTSIVGATNTPSALAIGVQGQSSSTTGRGVYGLASATTGGAYGGLFRSRSSQGFGVLALADSATGATAGIRGQSSSDSGSGLWGLATASMGQTNGMYGQADSADGAGISGLASSKSGVTYGVYGETRSLTDGFGVYCIGDSAATGLKLFQIDHPLDPANRLLNHFSEEGPEPYLVYRGNAVLDQNGAAVVQLPDYFEAINRDPTYQLTPIGGPANLYVAQEVVNNRFVIAGGEPGMKVSWTVTGTRNDAFVQRYGARREVAKMGAQRGTFLHPELYGQPATRAMRVQPVAEVIAEPGAGSARD